MHIHLRKRILLYKYAFCVRPFSTQVSKKTVKYTNTVNLPKTKFPSRLSVAKRCEIERNLVETSCAGLYQHQQQHNDDPPFVLHDGPPYANGDLHMGHAVNKILKDITMRHHVIEGRKVDFKPGWDCHGLPIELKAMGGQSNLDPLKIREKSRIFATEASEAQLEEFKSWGIMADWNNPSNLYKTFRPEYIQHEFRIFHDLYNKGLVYRDLKPVFWSPSSKTALAEAELEYDPNFTSPSIMLRLKLSRIPEELKKLNNLEGSLYAVIWTTTPWTLPSNQAVCYNPLLEYSVIRMLDDVSNLYIIASNLLNEFLSIINRNAETLTTINGTQLNGASYIHPIDRSSELPFLPSQHVQDNKGTGLVHTAPAHGPDDFLIGLKHSMSIKSLVDENGKFNNKAPDFLNARHVLDEGNELVTKVLDRDLLFAGKIVHPYPIDWRTKKPVIIRASDQWFINTEKIKRKAIEEISKINIYPRMSSDANKRALIVQLEKRPYWCISRQRAWGVPIPVFYENITKQPIINEHTMNAISNLLKEHGNMDFWWSGDTARLIPQQVWDKSNVEIDNLVQGKDIFDIWFDSGVSWSYALETEKIADLYLEGYDQFTGWFQSSLMTSIAHRGTAPYKSIFVHGFTVDEKGYKMSKSLGNVMLPRDTIKKHGVDVLRWWVASHGTQHSSIMISDNLLQSSADALNKIRLTLKFLNGTIDIKNEKKSDEESSSYLNKYMRNELWKFHQEVHNLYANYDYNRVAVRLQNFISNQMSSVYFNLIKDRLYCGTDDEINETQSVLRDCYCILCKALWPIVPFVVEESWSYYDKNEFYKQKVQPLESWQDIHAEEVVNTALELKQLVNQKIKDVNTWTVDTQIKCNTNKLGLLKCLHSELEKQLSSTELCEILQVSSINLSKGDTNDFAVDCRIIKNNLCPRCRRFSVQEVDSLCERCDLVVRQNVS